MRTLIRDAIVVTADPSGAVFTPGSVLVDGRDIVDVGPAADVAARGAAADRVIDARGMLLAPGFVSVHNHLGYSVFRGRAEDVGLRCVTGQYYPMATVMSREERCAIGAWTLFELLRGGVTTVLEMEEEADVFAPVVERLGSRAALGVMVLDADIDRMAHDDYHFDTGLRDRQLAQAVELAERWHGGADGRIAVMMTPNMTISSSPELLRGVRERADRLGLRLSIHLGCSAYENEVTQRLHGEGSFAYAHRHGLMGDDVVAAHCYHVDDADMDLIARTGTHVAHCPLMNAMRGRIAPVADYLARGVEVGLGIDNYFVDHYDVMRACMMVARIRSGDALGMPSGETLRLATRGAAAVLGMADRIGSIETGKRADLQLVELRLPGLTPMNDPVATLLHHGHAGNVRLVMVDGAVLVEEGRALSVDEQALREAADAANRAAWRRFVAKYGGTMAGG